MHRQQMELLLTDDLLLQGHWGKEDAAGGGEVLLNVLRCQLTYLGQVVTNAEARFNNSLRPRKPDSHTAPEL